MSSLSDKVMLDEDFSPYLTGGSNLISIIESGSE